MKLADNQSLFVSPSKMNIGLKNIIFSGKNRNNQLDGQFTGLNTTKSTRRAYPNIFSNRSIAPADVGIDMNIEGLTSPKGSMMR